MDKTDYTYSDSKSYVRTSRPSCPRPNMSRLSLGASFHVRPVEDARPSHLFCFNLWKTVRSCGGLALALLLLLCSVPFWPRVFPSVPPAQHDFLAEIADLKEQLVQLREKGDCPAMERKLAELESKMDCREYVEGRIRDEIAKYDNDKTGRADFALLTAGGAIVSSSPSYEKYYEAYSVLGFHPLRTYSDPRDLITPGNWPGNCWAMNGTEGFVVIRLRAVVRVEGFSYEHVSAAMGGSRGSAPRGFAVYSMMSEGDPMPDLLGRFEYSLGGAPIQSFALGRAVRTDILKFAVESNHGDRRYTCLYRIRVHGEAADL